MAQQRNNTNFNYFYRDHNGIRRRYGIYAPAIDRFIHISDQDMWMSFETAEVLSSKIQTMVYVLPPGYVTPDHKEVVSNNNCIEWGIFDKSTLTIGSGSVLGARQTPTLRMLFPEDRLEHHDDFPEDFIEDPKLLIDVKKYVDYAYKIIAAANISANYYNPYFSKRFLDNYIDQDWVKDSGNKYDVSNSPKGVEFEIKKILYESNNQEEAENRITNFWKDNYFDAGFMLTGYYRVLGVPIPDVLKPLSTNVHYFNHSVWVI